MHDFKEISVGERAFLVKGKKKRPLAKKGFLVLDIQTWNHDSLASHEDFFS